MTVPVQLQRLGAATVWRPLRRDAVTTAALTIAAGGWATACLWPSFGPNPTLSVACFAVTMAFVAAGVFVVREPNRRTAGVMFVLTGALSPLNSGVGWDWGPLPFIRGLTEGIFWIAFFRALLSYQDPKLSRPEKCFLLYLWFYFVSGQLIWDLVSRPEWQSYPATVWWPPSFPDRATFDTVTFVLNVGAFVGVAGFIAIVLSRRRRTSRLDRHLLAPMVLASVTASLAAATAYSAANTVTVVEQSLLSTIPLAFLVSAVRIRLLQGKLSVALAQLAQTPTLTAVEDMLRTALRDPTVAVHYWVPEQQTYVTKSGKPVDPDSVPSSRIKVPVLSSEGKRLAVVTTDASLPRTRSYVDAAVRASGLALENARLQAVIQAQVESIRQAQARIVQVSLDERKRLERNLHDGAQQQLLSVATSIGLASTQTHDDNLQTTLSQAAQDLQHALRELRELARGLHPAILSSDGLAAAVQVVAERLPIPIHVDIDRTRLPAAVESTAYYVICEALTNVVKHSQAVQATATAHVEGSRLNFKISDNGIGGANPTGNGISGMTDRIHAMGGNISIRSEHLSGTLISAWVPTD